VLTLGLQVKVNASLCAQDWDKKEEVVPIPGETMADLGSDSDDSD